jgi:mono/diheme cytochrome c family protein
MRERTGLPTSFGAYPIFFTLMIGVFGVLPASAAEKSPEAAPKLRARELYVRHCARCHGLNGTGDGDAHTMQRPWPRDFTTGEYKFRSTPAGTLPLLSDVERSVANGLPRTSMSGYAKWLTPEEIRLVSEYVLDLSRTSGLPEAPEKAVRIPSGLESGAAPADAPRLARGKAVFAANCVSCHGADGRGLGELAPALKDKNGFLINPVDLTDAHGYGGGSSAADIYRTLTTGIPGSPMPLFGGTLDDAARADVAAYVRSLQVAPADRTLPDPAAWRRALPAKERGEYLVRAMSCALCHNSYDAAGAYYSKSYLAGGVAITLPGMGVFPTRNITSHPADGLGKWSEEEVLRVITAGHAPDRRIEAFSMPWVYFSHLTDEDARDIAAYVKSLKAYENKVPPRRYYPVWERLWTRIKQVTGLERGRLEYPPYNVGSRPAQAEKLDAARERDARLKLAGIEPTPEYGEVRR